MKNLIIIVIIVAVIGGAMYLFLEHEPKQEVLLTGTAMDNTKKGVGSDQLSVLKTLKGLVIDTTVFDTAIWKSFRDSSHVIQDQPISRPNPFAPINAAEPNVATSTVR